MHPLDTKKTQNMLYLTLTEQGAHHEMRQRTWTFLRRHRARIYYKIWKLLSNEAEVYKNFAMVKSNLQLNLKLIITSK